MTNSLTVSCFSSQSCCAVATSVLVLAAAASVAGGVNLRSRSAASEMAPPFESTAPSSLHVPSLAPSMSQAPSIETCYEDPVFKNGRAVLEFEGFRRILVDREKVILEDAFKAAYNDVSAGCFDIYQRFLDASEIVNQTLITDQTGPPILAAEFAATVRCRNCYDREPLFGRTNSSRSASQKSSPLVGHSHLPGSLFQRNSLLNYETLFQPAIHLQARH